MVTIDFEYNRSSDPDMGLMAVAWKVGDVKDSMWLYNDPEAKRRFCAMVTHWHIEGHTFLAHNVVAEASCFIALGLEPRDYQWLDTYVEYRQLQNHNNDYQYGKYITEKPFKKVVESKPLFHRTELLELDELFGSEREAEIARKKHYVPDSSQLNATLENLILNIVPEAEYDPNVKRDARRLILECKDEYSEEEKAQILDYAQDDVEYLELAMDRMLEIEAERLQWPVSKVERAAQWRARYSVNVAKYTMYGIPLHLDRLANLEHNAGAVLNEAKENFNREQFPIFQYSKGPDGWKMRKSTAKTNEMIGILVKEFGLKWKKTAKGDYSTSTADGEPLQQYEDIHPWLKNFVRVRNLEAVLKGYKEPDMSVNILDRDAVFRDRVGCDGRLRPWYGPFGTQTGRNAPAAKGFVFAQAAVMRALVNPPKGRVIFEADYGSQEAFIAPILSGDMALLDAYESGDPYLAFAIATGAAPPDATKDSHNDVRKLYKSTVLGLQYGMGAAKLAMKLTADTGKNVSVDTARELIQQHKDVYPRYYEWKDELWELYRHNQRPLVLADGWYLDVDSLSRLSVLNFPVQGNGSAMMRVAIDLLYDNDINVLCPVHDSMIVECREEDLDKTAKIVAKCMLEASKRVLGVDGMRVGEPEIVRHDEYWETEKNIYDLPKFKKYFESQINNDPNHKIIEKVLAN